MSDLDFRNAVALAQLANQRLQKRANRGTGGSRHVGRLRVAAAKILSDGLGWEVYPEEIHPVTGSWRTCKHHDVCRWSLFTQQDRNPNMPYVADCWESLTDFVRLAKKHGFHVSDGFIYSGKGK